jgi:hypothetical protein
LEEVQVAPSEGIGVVGLAVGGAAGRASKAGTAWESGSSPKSVMVFKRV